MSGWTMPVQQASFKGVQFDVIAVDEIFDKAIAEHAYPFVNGADLEDMGLNPQTIKL
ncbi:DNA circularization N-terminal domain-containing protein, partial [Glaesserella parasuis]|nr:DNA circularization N-terminal domain-containing protein [Glaesserella parasuis]